MHNPDADLRWIQSLDIIANIAILRNQVKFDSLGLVILDDQRFQQFLIAMNGVRKLKKKIKASEDRNEIELLKKKKARTIENARDAWTTEKSKQCKRTDEKAQFIMAPYCIHGGTEAQYSSGHWVLFVFEQSQNLLLVFDSMSTVIPESLPNGHKIERLNDNHPALADDCTQPIYNYELEALNVFKFLGEADPKGSKIFKPAPDNSPIVDFDGIEYAYHHVQNPQSLARDQKISLNSTSEIDLASESDSQIEMPTQSQQIDPETTFFIQQTDAKTCGHRCLLLLDWFITMISRGADVSDGALPLPYFKSQGKFMYDSWCQSVQILVSKQLPMSPRVLTQQ